MMLSFNFEKSGNIPFLISTINFLLPSHYGRSVVLGRLPYRGETKRLILEKFVAFGEMMRMGAEVLGKKLEKNLSRPGQTGGDGVALNREL